MVRLRLEKGHSVIGVGLSFNPTVVRLRPGRYTLTEDIVNTFNPTVVRLRRPHMGNPKQPIPAFNPTVVRLRHDAELLVKFNRNFQSHCGAIAT